MCLDFFTHRQRAPATRLVQYELPATPVRPYPALDYDKLSTLQSSEDLIEDPEHHVIALRSYDTSRHPFIATDFVALTLGQNFPEKPLISQSRSKGWKVHLSLDEMGNNLSLGWNLVKDILISRGVGSFKVIRPGASLRGAQGQEGKQITIYLNVNTTYSIGTWKSILDEVENALIAAGIQPGPNCAEQALPDKPEFAILGSRYLYCRYDTGRVNYASTATSAGDNPLLRDFNRRITIGNIVDQPALQVHRV